ncbi:MAG TPA: hypothetical protein VNL71_21350 [Chloroflexota bacterium]|nr:hypothetical protein [Chloroflexota bacterium]
MAAVKSNPATNWPALTEWASGRRYPGELDSVSGSLALDLVTQARAVLEAVEVEITRRGG